jgi:hypothetical protein
MEFNFDLSQPELAIALALVLLSSLVAIVVNLRERA